MIGSSLLKIEVNEDWKLYIGGKDVQVVQAIRETCSSPTRSSDIEEENDSTDHTIDDNPEQVSNDDESS